MDAPPPRTSRPMNRRDSLKTFFVGTVGGGLGLHAACRTDAAEAPPATIPFPAAAAPAEESRAAA